MAQSVLLPQRAVKRGQLRSFLVRQRTAIRARGKILEREQMTRFGIHARLLDPANVGGHALEKVFDHLDGQSVGSGGFGGFGDINLGQAFDLRFRGDVLVFRAREVELGSAEERGFPAFEPDKVLVLAHGRGGYEIKFVPESVQFAPPLRVENELIKRLVVPEISHHAVEPGAQEPSLEVLLFLRIEIDASPFRDEEGVREKRAEPVERRFVRFDFSAIGWNRHRPGGGGAGDRMAGKESRAIDLQGPAKVMHPVCGILAIFPENQRLRALVDSPDG